MVSGRCWILGGRKHVYFVCTKYLYMSTICSYAAYVCIHGYEHFTYSIYTYIYICVYLPATSRIARNKRLGNLDAQAAQIISVQVPAPSNTDASYAPRLQHNDLWFTCFTGWNRSVVGVFSLLGFWRYRHSLVLGGSFPLYRLSSLDSK